MGGLKAASLDTGTLISPSLARRIAREAGVIPVVLGGESQVERGAVPNNSCDNPANPQKIEPLTNNGLQVRVEEGSH